MSQRSTVIYTTGKAGSGKSYCRCARFLVETWLKNSPEKARHYSNFPIKMEPWKDKHGKGMRGLKQIVSNFMGSELLESKIRLIPAEELKCWENQDWKPHLGKPAGPWDYFGEADISGCHIAIDEIHNYCGTHSPLGVRKAWQVWLGELRHRGATIEFLTQHDAKTAAEIKIEAGLRYELIPGEFRKDPFGIASMYTWYNLRAKLGFGWRPYVQVLEKQEFDGKWRTINEDYFYFQGVHYEVYDSFNAPVAGGVAGATEKHPYESLGWFKFLLWIFTANIQSLGTYLTWGIIGFLLLIFSEDLGKMFLHKMASIPGDKKNAVVNKQAVKVSSQPVTQGSPQPKVEEKKVVQNIEIRTQSKEEQNKVIELIQEAERLAAKVGELESTIVQLEDENKALQEKINHAFSLANLNSEQVTFRGGYSYDIGEIIDWGPYEGLRVVEINWAKKTARLSDGKTLRMGIDTNNKPNTVVQVAAEGAKEAAKQSGVSELLQSSGGAASSGEAKISGWRERNDSNQLHENGRLR